MNKKPEPLLVMVYQTNPFAQVQGGGVRYVRELVSAIESKGVQITFFGVGGKAEIRGNIRYVPVMQNPNHPLLFMAKCALARWRLIGSREAVVHVHRLYFALPFLGGSIRCIATLHGRTFTVFPERFGSLLSGLVFPLFKTIEGWLLSRVARIVAVSTDVRDQFYARHGDRARSRDIQIIPSMVNLSAFRPRQSRFFADVHGENPVCLFVGRLASVKNLPLLLDAWELVARDCPDARLAIAGDGELRDQLDVWIARMDSASSVVLLGQVSPSAIADAICSAKVLLLSSHHEASPTVVKEALACGVPVVSTPVGDVASLIDDGRTGRIVEKDAGAFAGAIVEVLAWKSTNEDIAMAAHRVLDRCSPNNVAEAYLSIYRELGYAPSVCS
jgi:glycosyltransferase involved in cell wall biosynthesis